MLIKARAVGSEALLADVPAEPQPAILGIETQ
jgi:hypothetical protein